MEMVEEISRNQPKSCPKRIKYQEIEKGEVDRVSALPDFLILEILSRLPSTEDAIRTGTLSKRWKHLWTSIPTLIFTHLESNLPRSEFFSFVDKTLSQRRQLNLKKFGVYTLYDIQFESQVKNWIRYAISCNVEELILKLYPVSQAECQLDQILFICSCSNLTLEGCILNPPGAISWNNLKSLSISNAKLDEELIENILSGSPVLETLVLHDCYGFNRLNITSKSVKKLVLFGYKDPEAEYDEELAEILKINAPNILSLTIKGDLLLWKVLLVNVSSLVKAKLNYYIKLGDCEMLLKEEKEEILKDIILNLCHVSELKIGVFCCKVLSRLEAEGFISPINIKFGDGDYERMKLGDWSESESDSYCNSV